MQVTLTAEAVTALVMAFGGALLGWLAYLHTQVEHIKIGLAETRLENKTLWDFQLRRGAIEAVGSGIATRNSPLRVRDEFLKHAGSLVEPLQDFYRKLGRPDISPSELAFQIELHFGDQILEKICLPEGVSQGACMIVAIAIARDDPVVDV